MLKMADVIGQKLAQNFSNILHGSSDVLSEQLNQGVLNASDSALSTAFVNFFNQVDAVEATAALGIPAERIDSIRQGLELKTDSNLADTLKVVTLCLAMEHNLLDQIEIFDSLHDFPM